MKVRLTRDADRDLVDIMAQTLKLFEENQVRRYGEDVKRGIALIAEQPNRPSSRDRSDIKPGVRAFHLQFAAGRSRGAAHVLYFRLSQKTDEIVILRVLGDSMEPRRRVARTLRRDVENKKSGD